MASQATQDSRTMAVPNAASELAPPALAQRTVVVAVPQNPLRDGQTERNVNHQSSCTAAVYYSHTTEPRYSSRSRLPRARSRDWKCGSLRWASSGISGAPALPRLGEKQSLRALLVDRMCKPSLFINFSGSIKPKILPSFLSLVSNLSMDIILTIGPKNF